MKTLISSLVCIYYLCNCILGQNQVLTAGDSVSNRSHSNCPEGKDTTVAISPYYDATYYFYQHKGLPSHGEWFPPLERSSLYNSCADSSSIYVYTKSSPGCPDVQDTVYFELTTDPPCGFEITDKCFTPDALYLMIPAFPAASGDPVYHLAVEVNDWPAYEHYYFELHFDFAYNLVCPIEWVDGCTWIELYHADYYWPLSDFAHLDDWWECGFPLCSTTEVTNVIQDRITEIPVYPNPTNDIFHFSIGQDDLQSYSLTLANSTGQIILEKQTDERELNIAHLPAGLYFLQLQAKEWVGMAKIMKYE